MRVVFHIGAHKTGTSSIQSTMMHSTVTLSEMGVLYPRCCWLDSAHHRLAYAMKQKKDPRQNDLPSLDAELAALSEVLRNSNAHTTLVSSEEFFTAPKPAIEQVAEGLKEHDVEVVAYVRRPDELIESAFNQRLKQVYRDFRKDTNIFYHIDDFLENPEMIIADIDYNRHISKWADVFGDPQVKLVQYEMADAVVSMCGILGVDRSLLIDTSSRENPRASQKVVAMLRLAREVGASLDAQVRLRDLAWAKFPHKEGTGLLDSRDRRLILEKYSKGTETLFRRLLNQDNPYDPERLLQEENFGGKDDRLLMPDLMQVIVLLYAQLADLEQQLSHARGSLERAESELESATSGRQNLQARQAELKAEISRIIEERSQAQAMARERAAKMAELRAELSERERLLATLSAREQEQGQLIKLREGEIRELQDEVTLSREREAQLSATLAIRDQAESALRSTAAQQLEAPDKNKPA